MSWWRKNNPDALAARISSRETLEMLAGAANTAGSGILGGLKKVIGGLLNIATLGVADRGKPVGDKGVGRVDWTVGPGDAALLIRDGKPATEVLTADRVSTQTVWDSIDSLLGADPRVEALLAQIDPFTIEMPVNIVDTGAKVDRFTGTLSFNLAIPAEPAGLAHLYSAIGAGTFAGGGQPGYMLTKGQLQRLVKKQLDSGLMQRLLRSGGSDWRNRLSADLAREIGGILAPLGISVRAVSVEIPPTEQEKLRIQQAEGEMKRQLKAAIAAEERAEQALSGQIEVDNEKLRLLLDQNRDVIANERIAWENEKRLRDKERDGKQKVAEQILDNDTNLALLEAQNAGEVIDLTAHRDLLRDVVPIEKEIRELQAQRNLPPPPPLPQVRRSPPEPRDPDAWG